MQYLPRKFPFFSRSWIGLASQFCVVCNSHNIMKLAQGKFVVGQGKNRENTGNLKVQFEWVPCHIFRNFRPVVLYKGKITLQRNYITFLKLVHSKLYIGPHFWEARS